MIIKQAVQIVALPLLITAIPGQNNLTLQLEILPAGKYLLNGFTNRGGKIVLGFVKQ